MLEMKAEKEVVKSEKQQNNYLLLIKSFHLKAWKACAPCGNLL
jgi:hypothetical protein